MAHQPLSNGPEAGLSPKGDGCSNGQPQGCALPPAPSGCKGYSATQRLLRDGLHKLEQRLSLIKSAGTGDKGSNRLGILQRLLEGKEFPVSRS